jgi:hypothetical protein
VCLHDIVGKQYKIFVYLEAMLMLYVVVLDSKVCSSPFPMS